MRNRYTIAALLTLAVSGCWGCSGKESAAPAAAPAPARAKPTGELDPAKAKYIWDLEHVTFLFETYVGKPFVGDLARRDGDAVARFFRTSFEGRVLDATAGEQRRASVVSDSRRNRDTAGERSVSGPAYAARLVAAMAEFAEVERGRLRVLQIDEVAGRPGHWSAQLLLALVGKSVDGGPIEYRSEHEVEFAFEDETVIKETGRVLDRGWMVSESLTRSEQSLMEEVTESAGLARLGLLDNWELPLKQTRNRRYQPAVEDFNRDGYPDIAVASPDGRPLLLRSVQGRRFLNVADSMGLLRSDPQELNQAINALAAWIDYDNDGWPDLLMGHRLYRNVQGQRFRDVSAQTGLKFDRVPLGVLVVDYDADGKLDMYILYQKGFREAPRNTKPWVGDTEGGAENQLWRNEGGGRFRNVTQAAGAGAGRHQTFAGSTFFLDGDRFPDFYLANDFGENVLLRNRGDGTFEDVTRAVGAGDFATSMGVTTGDLDNDGVPEIYVANMYSKMGRRIIAHVDEADYPPGVFEQIEGSCAGNRLYRMKSGAMRFEEVSADLGVNEVGWAYAPAMADLDGDGWLDLYASTGYMSFDRGEPDG